MLLLPKWDLEEEVDLGDGRVLIYDGGKALGRGATAVVFPCVLRERKGGRVTSRDVAVKCEKVGVVDERMAEEQMEIHERIGKYDHDNVMATLAVKVLEEGESRFFSVLSVSEQMDGDLDCLIFKDDAFTKRCTYRDLMEVLKQTCWGLDDLHSRNIIHYDLKPGNVLFARRLDSLVIKLTDFGFSKPIQDGRSSVVGSTRGTPEYMAPEIHAVGPFPDENFKLSKALDIYSIGVMMWVLLNRKKPQEAIHCPSSDLGRKIVWPTILNKSRKVWCSAPLVLCDLVESCLAFPRLDMDKHYGRPNVKTILDTILSVEQEGWMRDRVFAYTEVGVQAKQAASFQSDAKWSTL